MMDAQKTFICSQGGGDSGLVVFVPVRDRGELGAPV